MFNMPNLKKMLITGDRRQLKVHLESLPRAVQVGFGLDSVIINLDASDGIGKTALQVGYRSHPHIVQCIEAGFYRPHGERLIAGRNPEERNMLTASQLKLPKAGSPLILIHQVDEAERDAVSMSSYNPGQTWTALRILWRLFNVLPPDSSILCICLYGTQANDIEREVLAEEELNRSVGNYSRRNTRPRSRSISHLFKSLLILSSIISPIWQSKGMNPADKHMRDLCLQF